MALEQLPARGRARRGTASLACEPRRDARRVARATAARKRGLPQRAAAPAKLHLAVRVLQACRRNGVHFLLIPAQMTWLLQPCDTREFSLYKAFIAEFMHRCAGRSEDGKTYLG